jgi:hypothetical protein
MHRYILSGLVIQFFLTLGASPANAEVLPSEIQQIQSETANDIFAKGADSHAKPPTAKAVYIDDGLWQDPFVAVDGKRFSKHFLNGYTGLADAMTSNPKAAKYAELASEQSRWGSLFGWGGLGAAMVYWSANRGAKFNTGVYFSILSATAIPGFLFDRASRKNVARAVSEYSGQTPYLYRVAKLVPDGFIILPNETGARAALKWSF